MEEENILHFLIDQDLQCSTDKLHLKQAITFNKQVALKDSRGRKRKILSKKIANPSKG